MTKGLKKITFHPSKKNEPPRGVAESTARRERDSSPATEKEHLNETDAAGAFCHHAARKTEMEASAVNYGPIPNQDRIFLVCHNEIKQKSRVQKCALQSGKTIKNVISRLNKTNSMSK